MSPQAPRPLPARATIGIWAPSGLLADQEALPRASAALAALGHRVVVGAHVHGRDGYFAGTVAERLADLQALVADPAIDLILAARGGFGLSHLLPLIDWNACAASRKLFCGFSDFTAFHLALHSGTGQVSIAGPMAVSDLAGPSPSGLHADQFWGLLQQGTRRHSYPDWQHDGPSLDVQLRGTLWGGNLNLLCHLVGTPFFPVINDGFLYLEDISEAPYRIERMLMQLELAGVLQRQQAILLGAFTGCDPLPGAPALYTLNEVIAALRKRFAGPVLTGLPFGHIRDKVALPFAAQAGLIVDGQRWRLSVEPFLAP